MAACQSATARRKPLPADCQSAIQQVANLRYPHPGPAPQWSRQDAPQNLRDLPAVAGHKARCAHVPVSRNTTRRTGHRQPGPPLAARTVDTSASHLCDRHGLHATCASRCRAGVCLRRSGLQAENPLQETESRVRKTRLPEVALGRSGNKPVRARPAATLRFVTCHPDAAEVFAKSAGSGKGWARAADTLRASCRARGGLPNSALRMA